MEIYQLRTFVTVAQQGHLTQAAEQLHLSQPAVTAQIKALEEEVGLPLFERTAGGVMLTLAGQELLPRAQAILESARELVHHARGLKGLQGGRARIGVSLEPASLRLGAWIAALTRTSPLMDLRLHYGVTGDVLNLVRKKELDAGFYLGKNPYVNVETVLLTRVPFVITLPPGWSDRVAPGQVKDLGRIPWIGLSQFSSLSRMTGELWRELNISPRKITECDHLDVVVELVCAGVGAALVRADRARALAAAGRLSIVPDLEKRVELQFVYPAEMASDPLTATLCAALAEVWPQDAAGRD